MRTFSVRLLAVAAVLLLGGATGACSAASGSTGGSGDGGSGGGGSGGGGSGEATLSVADPASGANVSLPFTVKVNSSVPLGTTDTGLHHVHIWFDGHEDQYKISYTATAQ